MAEAEKEKTTLDKLKEKEKHYMSQASMFSRQIHGGIGKTIAQTHVIMYSELAAITRILIEKEEKNNS